MSKSKAKASGKSAAAKASSQQKKGNNSAKMSAKPKNAASGKNGKKPNNSRFNANRPIVGKKPARTAADVIAEAAGSKLNLWACLIAFAIPLILTLLAYVKFDVYPFGKRSVLTLDLNGQYIYYFEAIRDAFWGDGSIFYNWSRNLSGGFMGVIGYYLASPFTFIVILMPRKLILEAVMIMQMCKVGAAGAAFCIYAQRSKRLQPLPSVIMSTAYAMMSYIAIQLINPMWIDGPIFLPLIILGVEYLVDDGRKLNYIIPTALMFIANFYIGFMVAIFVAIYFVYYLFFGAKKKFKDITDYAKTCGIMIGSTVVVLMCSLIMILPVYNALALGKFDFSEPVYDWKQRLFKLPELIPCLLPNQYYSVNVDTGTRYYGRPEIYCGVITLVLAPLFFCNKKIKFNRKIGNALLILTMVMSMYIKPLNMYWHGGQDPNWLPYRYSFLLSFILVSMASEIFANLDGYKLSIYSTGGTFAGIAVFALWFKQLMPKYNYNEEKGYKYVAVKSYKAEMNYGSDRWQELYIGTIAFGIALAAVYLVLLFAYSHSKKKSVKTTILVATAGLVCFEGGYNCYDSFRKIYKEVGNSCHASYADILDAPKLVKELEEYDGSFYRAEKTYQRMVNDNMAYGLKGVTHSSSVMNTRAINFLTNIGYFTQSYESKYEGNSPLADSLLGIKYVFYDPQRTNGSKKVLDASYNKIYTTSYNTYHEPEQEIKANELEVYENPNALAIGYMADDDIIRFGSLGNDNPFNNLNNFLSAATGNTPAIADPNVESGIILVPKQYYKRVENVSVNFPEDSVYLHDYRNPGSGTIHDCYEAKEGASDAVVNVDMTVPQTGDLYMHLGSEIKKQCNVWVGIKDPETGTYRGRETSFYDGCGSYFETNSTPIVRLGKFTEGEEIEVRFTILSTGPNGTYDGTDEYIMVRQTEADGGSGFHFYYLDNEAFLSDIARLKEHQWEIDMDKSNDRHLVGKVTAGEDQIMITSIPYEPGWTVKVDGKKLPAQIVERTDENGKVKLLNYDKGDGEVILMDSLIGVRMAPGEHTVELIYTPPGFTTGVVTLILGIGALVAIFIYDRKKNPVLVAKRRMKEEKANGNAAENGNEKSKKKVQIIKSKGAIENPDAVVAEINEKAKKSGGKKSEEKPKTEKSDDEEKSSQEPEQAEE